MKKYFCVLSLGLIAVIRINAQVMTNTLPTLTLQDVQIVSINNAVEQIKAGMNSYRKVEKFKNNTGYDNGYFKENKLQLIKVLYKDTITEKNVEWYFNNGLLIYSMQLWIDVKTKDTLDYERYYLSNERFIAWFKFDKPVERNSVVFKKLAYRMRDYIGDLKLEYIK